MDENGTSRTIVNHSIHIMLAHPKLLFFPLVTLLGGLLAVGFFYGPLLLDVTSVEFWQAIWNPAHARVPALVSWNAADHAVHGAWRSVPHLVELGALYLLGMFIMTFLNAALCSQVIEAMNGGRVSIWRGLARANAILPAIFCWSLLAGMVGLILRNIEARVGFVGRWITALLGLSWSVASVFVIPVMLREPRTRSPLAYLRISTVLIRRVWGEGVVGYMDLYALHRGRWRTPSLWRDLAMFTWAALTAAGLMGMMGDSFRVGFVVALLIFILFYPLVVLYQVFQCGLYVYATEGVAPGSFDADTFDRVWTVKDPAE